MAWCCEVRRQPAICAATGACGWAAPGSGCQEGCVASRQRRSGLVPAARSAGAPRSLVRGNWGLLDVPVAEIADLHGLSDGGVKHALFRARRSLADILTSEEEVTS